MINFVIKTSPTEYFKNHIEVGLFTRFIVEKYGKRMFEVVKTLQPHEEWVFNLDETCPIIQVSDYSRFDNKMEPMIYEHTKGFTPRFRLHIMKGCGKTTTNVLGNTMACEYGRFNDNDFACTDLLEIQWNSATYGIDYWEMLSELFESE